MFVHMQRALSCDCSWPSAGQAGNCHAIGWIRACLSSAGPGLHHLRNVPRGQSCTIPAQPVTGPLPHYTSTATCHTPCTYDALNLEPFDNHQPTT